MPAVLRGRAVATVAVAALLILAFALRLGEVERTTNTYRPINDAGSYLTLASYIARTGDYSTSRNPGSGAGGTRGPSANFPPAYPYFLALVDLIDGHSVRRGAAIQPARVSQAVLGTITVALIGLVAFELFGGTAGLIALALAAIYPVLIELAGTLVAENLATPLILAAVYAGLRVRRARGARTRWAWVVGTGVLAGLAALAHENAILIVLPLILAVWTGRPRLKLRSLAAPAVMVVVAALTIVPWTIRNEVTMHRFIPIADETGITLVGTYNVASAANPQVPYKWRIFYGIPHERPLIHIESTLTEPELEDRLQSQAFHYISDHPFSPFAVAFYNTKRLFELEGAYAWEASASAISLPTSDARVGLFSFWVLCLLAIAGAFTKLVRRAPLWVWAVPVLLWLSVVLVNVETPRFREPLDPFLILLATAGLTTAVARLRRAPVVREARGPVATPTAQLVEMVERLA